MSEKKNSAPIIVSACVILLYLCSTHFELSLFNFVNGLSVSAIVLLILGLARVVGNSGFFITAAFGMNKLVEVIKTKEYSKEKAKYKDRFEYEKEHRKHHYAVGFFIFAAAEFTVCFLLTALL